MCSCLLLQYANQTAVIGRDDDDLVTSLTRDVEGLTMHHFILYEFLLCSAVAVGACVGTLRC